MFIENKYTNWYYSIINAAKCQSRNKDNGYFESHHIIPSCMGGVERVLLTAREHYICHLLLTKMVSSPEHKQKMSYALWLMNRSNQYHQRYSAKSRLYEYSRRLHSESVSKLFKDRIFSDETRKKLSAWQKGVPKSEEHKQALKRAHRGMTGRKHSEETKAKMRKPKQKKELHK